MITVRHSIFVATALLCSWAGALPAAEGTELYAPRSAEQVRQELLRWLSHHGVTNEKPVASIVQLWAPATPPLAPRQIFDRLIQSFSPGRSDDPPIRQHVRSGRVVPLAPQAVAHAG